MFYLTHLTSIGIIYTLCFVEYSAVCTMGGGNGQKGWQKIAFINSKSFPRLQYQ